MRDTCRHDGACRLEECNPIFRRNGAKVHSLTHVCSGSASVFTDWVLQLVGIDDPDHKGYEYLPESLVYHIVHVRLPEERRTYVSTSIYAGENRGLCIEELAARKTRDPDIQLEVEPSDHNLIVKVILYNPLLTELFNYTIGQIRIHWPANRSLNIGTPDKARRPRGGRPTRPLEQKQAIVQAWHKAQQKHIKQRQFCNEQGISPATLRRYLRLIEDQGSFERF
jgi:hypothetical protein